jgi:hypothetical protein
MLASEPHTLIGSVRLADNTKGEISMELEGLVGEHVLSGVDTGNEKVKESYGEGFEDCNVINFILDGVVYTAIEDPEDGYRSCMREIAVSDKKITNIFPGQRVLGRMRGTQGGEENDVLDLLDMKTGKIVLSVGTGNINDYYPYFVSEFTPENMSANG